jgi:hypothetical protein
MGRKRRARHWPGSFVFDAPDAARKKMRVVLTLAKCQPEALMLINGAHAIIYSTDADADRALFRDVFKLAHVDVGGGWLIFGLPPAEVAVHPAEDNGRHELYLMTDDIAGFVAEMQRRQLTCAPIDDQGWGLLTQLTLPGGGQLGVYQPRHPRPPA